MTSGPIDYKYSLDLVRRINHVVDNEPKLSKIFCRDGFNLWERYQGVLWSDVKYWSVERRVVEVRTTPINLLKNLIIGLALLVISLLSLGILILMRRRVMIFTEDKIEGLYKNDTRLDSLYSAIYKQESSYLEVVHTVPSLKTLKKFLSRMRPVIYLESIDFVLSPINYFREKMSRQVVSDLGWENLSQTEKIFIQSEMVKIISCIPTTMARLKFFEFLIRVSHVSILFSIDDTRHYSEFVTAGRVCQVPTYAIQHGHFTKYHTGWIKMTHLKGEIMRPSKLLVWSEYWERELMKLGSYFTPEEINVAGGNLKIYPRNVHGNKTAVLIPYENDAPKEELRVFIMKLIDCGYEVIFKIRNDQEDKNTQLAEYGLSTSQVTVVRSIGDVLGRVGLVVGTYSTFLYDCLESLLPVAIVETSLDYGEGMVQNGLASLISKDADLGTRIAELMGTSSDELELRRSRLLGEKPVYLESTIGDIIKKYASD